MLEVKGKLKVRGLKKHIEQFLAEFDKRCKDCKNEYNIRLCIQDILNDLKFEYKLDIMYDGNTVWPLNKTVNQIIKFLKNPILENFTPYIYGFFHLTCGTIAHYNREGWYNTYSLSEIKEILLKALDIQPCWAADRIRILKTIYKKMNWKRVEGWKIEDWRTPKVLAL